MTTIFKRTLTAVRRGYRAWRAEQLMPSVLFDLNRSLAEDIGIVPGDVIDALKRRRKS